MKSRYRILLRNICRRQAICIWVSVGFILAVTLIGNYVNESKYESELMKNVSDARKNNYKIVQMYTKCFGDANCGYRSGVDAFSHCNGERRCFFYSYIGKMNSYSDGVIVHLPNLMFLPAREKRNRKQIWLLRTIESQHTLCSHFYKATDLDDWFNLTATYKTDSDFVHSYASFTRLDYIKYDGYFMNHFLEAYPDKTTATLKLVSDLKQKDDVDKQAVWFVSHCETYGRREDYIRELRKYIKVDVYGKC